MQSNQLVQQSCSRLLEGLAAHNQATVSGKCPNSSILITPRCSGHTSHKPFGNSLSVFGFAHVSQSLPLEVDFYPVGH